MRFSLILLLLASPLAAAEIYSNGMGGGAWSEAGTWRGGAVPAAVDDVVLAHDDTVIFDRNDDGKPTCAKLSLDPRAVLQFKTNAGPIVLTVSGPVDSYGMIKLDATKAAGDRHEFRLIGATLEDRTFKVSKGGGLVVAGKAVFGKAKPNAALRAFGPPAPKAGDPPPDPTAVVDVGAGTTLDVQRAEFENIYLQATLIDNTGAKRGERINVVRNKFFGTSRLLLTSCDTPLVADNVFERDGSPALQQPAIYFNSCPLAEVRGNTVRGTYAGGITLYGGLDCSVTNNVIEKCPQGFYNYGLNTMVRGLRITDCDHGCSMTSASGVMEDVIIEKCASGYYQYSSTAQLTNVVIRDLRPNAAYHIYLDSSALTLLNCPLKPEHIKFGPNWGPPPAGKPPVPRVQSLWYLVAEVKGAATAGLGIELRTANPPMPLEAGAVDPNIRNSPAPVQSSGLTPLPKSLEPLIVRGWMYDPAGTLVKAPEYQLRVLGPAAAGQAERPVVKTQTATPQDDWYRANINDRKPTVEVTLP